jgi:HEPN domain-containing protein
MYDVAVYHAAIVVRLRLQAILHLVEPGAPHTCSSLATLSRLITKAREANNLKLVDVAESIRSKWKKLLACLDNISRLLPAGCGDPQEVFNQSRSLFYELEKAFNLATS